MFERPICQTMGYLKAKDREYHRAMDALKPLKIPNMAKKDFKSLTKLKMAARSNKRSTAAQNIAYLAKLAQQRQEILYAMNNPNFDKWRTALVEANEVFYQEQKDEQSVFDALKIEAFQGNIAVKDFKPLLEMILSMNAHVMSVDVSLLEPSDEVRIEKNLDQILVSIQRARNDLEAGGSAYKNSVCAYVAFLENTKEKLKNLNEPSVSFIFKDMVTPMSHSAFNDVFENLGSEANIEKAYLKTKSDGDEFQYFQDYHNWVNAKLVLKDKEEERPILKWMTEFYKHKVQISESVYLKKLNPNSLKKLHELRIERVDLELQSEIIKLVGRIEEKVKVQNRPMPNSSVQEYARYIIKVATLQQAVQEHATNEYWRHFLLQWLAAFFKAEFDKSISEYTELFGNEIPSDVLVGEESSSVEKDADTSSEDDPADHIFEEKINEIVRAAEFEEPKTLTATNKLAFFTFQVKNYEISLYLKREECSSVPWLKDFYWQEYNNAFERNLKVFGKKDCKMVGRTGHKLQKHTPDLAKAKIAQVLEAAKFIEPSIEDEAEYSEYIENLFLMQNIGNFRGQETAPVFAIDALIIQWMEKLYKEEKEAALRKFSKKYGRKMYRAEKEARPDVIPETFSPEADARVDTVFQSVKAILKAENNSIGPDLVKQANVASQEQLTSEQDIERSRCGGSGTPESEISDPKIPEPLTPESKTLESETPECKTPESEISDPKTLEAKTAEPLTPEFEISEHETLETPESESLEPETAKFETLKPKTLESETAESELSSIIVSSLENVSRSITMEQAFNIKLAEIVSATEFKEPTLAHNKDYINYVFENYYMCSSLKQEEASIPWLKEFFQGKKQLALVKYSEEYFNKFEFSAVADMMRRAKQKQGKQPVSVKEKVSQILDAAKFVEPSIINEAEYQKYVIDNMLMHLTAKECAAKDFHAGYKAEIVRWMEQFYEEEMENALKKYSDLYGRTRIVHHPSLATKTLLDRALAKTDFKQYDASSQVLPSEQDGDATLYLPSEQDGDATQDLPSEQDSVLILDLPSEQDSVLILDLPSEQDSVLSLDINVPSTLGPCSDLDENIVSPHSDLAVSWYYEYQNGPSPASGPPQDDLRNEKSVAAFEDYNDIQPTSLPTPQSVQAAEPSHSAMDDGVVDDPALEKHLPSAFDLLIAASQVDVADFTPSLIVDSPSDQSEESDCTVNTESEHEGPFNLSTDFVQAEETDCEQDPISTAHVDYADFLEVNGIEITWNNEEEKSDNQADFGVFLAANAIECILTNESECNVPIDLVDVSQADIGSFNQGNESDCTWTTESEHDGSADFITVPQAVVGSFDLSNESVCIWTNESEYNGSVDLLELPQADVGTLDQGDESNCTWTTESEHNASVDPFAAPLTAVEDFNQGNETDCTWTTESEHNGSVDLLIAPHFDFMESPVRDLVATQSDESDCSWITCSEPEESFDLSDAPQAAEEERDCTRNTESEHEGSFDELIAPQVSPVRDLVATQADATTWYDEYAGRNPEEQAVDDSLIVVWDDDYDGLDSDAPCSLLDRSLPAADPCFLFYQADTLQPSRITDDTEASTAVLTDEQSDGGSMASSELSAKPSSDGPGPYATTDLLDRSHTEAVDMEKPIELSREEEKPYRDDCNITRMLALILENQRGLEARLERMEGLLESRPSERYEDKDGSFIF